MARARLARIFGEFDLDPHLIPADRVVHSRRRIGRIERTPMPGVAVVVEDDFPVEGLDLAQLGHLSERSGPSGTSIPSSVIRTPFTSRSGRPDPV